MLRILIIGKPTYNVILPVANYLVEGSKNKLTSKLEMSGGTSIYVANLLAKWGVKELVYAGVVGNDIYGNKIKEELEAIEVNTKFVEVNFTAPTSMNYIIVNEATGSSTQVIVDDPSVVLQKYRFEAPPDYIIMDGTDIAGGNAAVNQYPNAKTILLANKVAEDVYSLTKRVNYVIANTRFAKALTKLELEVDKPKALVNFMQKIRDLQKAEYIVMMQEHGVLYVSEQQVKMIPAIALDKKVDDSNAGGVFFAAFCFGLIKEHSIDEAVKMANIAAGLSMTKLGSANSIPEMADVFNLAGIALPVEESPTEEAVVMEEQSDSTPDIPEGSPPENAFGENAQAAPETTNNE